MPRTIILESISDDGRTQIARLESGVVTLGRDTDNSLVVDSDSVSRRHACISEAGDDWAFRDFASTNGSWLNNVKVTEDQVRLLRSGDVLQLADLLLAVTEEPGAEIPPRITVLVFAGGQFHAEFPLLSVDSKVTIGLGGDLLIPGREDLRCVIRRSPGIVELETASESSQILVNGMAVGGVVALSDRDQIDVGDYKLVISNRMTHAAAPAFKRRTAAAVTNPPTYEREQLPEHLRDSVDEAEWESEASRRRIQSGRRFVFGTPVGDELDPSQTVAVPSVDFPGRPGFETNASLRFASSASEETGSGLNEKMLILVAAGVTLVLLCLIGWVVITL